MEFTDEQWAIVEPLLPKVPRRAARRGKTPIARSEIWMASCGYCVPVRLGTIYPTGIPLLPDLPSALPGVA